MNWKLPLSQLIQTFTGIAIFTLLAVIAEREEPGGHQHLAMLLIVLVLQIVHAASECISECFIRPETPKELHDQDQKGETHES